MKYINGLWHVVLIVLCWAVFMVALQGCAQFSRSAFYQDTYSSAQQRYVNLHQCISLVIVGYSNNLAPEQLALIRDAEDFWTNHTTRLVFVESEVLGDSGPADIYLTNNTQPYYQDARGKTHLEFDASGCITKTTITFYDLDSLPDWKQRWVVRHELGHALGLQDSNNVYNLSVMYYKLDQVVDPDYLNPSELEALKEYY